MNTDDARVTAEMTVDERLLHFDLFEPFDAAVQSNQLSAVVEVLLRAQLSGDQARRTAEKILADKRRRSSSSEANWSG